MICVKEDNFIKLGIKKWFSANLESYSFIMLGFRKIRVKLKLELFLEKSPSVIWLLASVN